MKCDNTTKIRCVLKRCVKQFLNELVFYINTSLVDYRSKIE